MAATEPWRIRIETPGRVLPVPDREPVHREAGPGVALAWAAAVALVLATRVPGAAGVRATTVAVAFVSLVLQSMPFLLAGAAIASLLRGPAGNRLLSAAARRPRLAAALAPLSGAALPLCDCGLVPLARRLRASVPRGSVVNGFVAGAPLTNPIVIVTTILAFPGSPGMVVGRVVVGLGVAMLAASLAPQPGGPRAVQVRPHDHRGGRSTLRDIGAELAGTGPTLVLGALAAGVIKGFIPAGAFASLGSQPLIGAAAMMVLAFLMSICAQADAFVAASLPVGALPRLAFLALGPVLDLRLAALYRREFGTRWILGYAAVVVPSVLVLATVWATWGFT